MTDHLQRPYLLHLRPTNQQLYSQTGVRRDIFNVFLGLTHTLVPTGIELHHKTSWS